MAKQWKGIRLDFMGSEIDIETVISAWIEADNPVAFDNLLKLKGWLRDSDISTPPNLEKYLSSSTEPKFSASKKKITLDNTIRDALIYIDIWIKNPDHGQLEMIYHDLAADPDIAGKDVYKLKKRIQTIKKEFALDVDPKTIYLDYLHFHSIAVTKLGDTRNAEREALKEVAHRYHAKQSDIKKIIKEFK